LVLLLSELGEAEIEDFHSSVSSDEDVLGFQITVDDPLLVRRGQAVGDLERMAERLSRSKGTASESGPKSLAFQQLLDHVGRAVLLSNVVDRRDIGMVQDPRGPGLLLESAQTVGVRCEKGRQDLDRDFATQPWILRPVHLSHPTGAQRREYLVGTDAITGGERHEPCENLNPRQRACAERTGRLA